MKSSKIKKLVKLAFAIFNLGLIGTIIALFAHFYPVLETKLTSAYHFDTLDQFMVGLPVLPVVFMLIAIALSVICTVLLCKFVCSKIQNYKINISVEKEN